MSRSIKTLRPPFTEAVTDDDVRAAALQYVRKISGFRAPAAHNAEAFSHAVDAVAARDRRPARDARSPDRQCLGATSAEILRACRPSRRTAPPPTAMSSSATAAPAAADCSCHRSRSGLWHNFGDDKPIESQRAILRRAFDLGVTHFDLANNYGPPYGAAEKNFGTIFAQDFRPYRDKLVLSTKAGYDMWPGPLRRMGVAK